MKTIPNTSAHNALAARSFRQLLKHKPAIAGLIILIILYTACLFAEFIAPYHYDNESRENSYNPPSKIHFIDNSGKFHFTPFVYKTGYSRDAYYNRIFVEDTSKAYPIRFFTRGDSYKFLGIISTDKHLFGVEKESRLYLFGADSRGRDLFSRLVYGSRVSLTVGLIGVFISTLFGVIIGGIAGFYGGAIDNIIMRLCEMLMLVPGFYLLLTLRAAFPPNVSSSTVYLLIILIMSFIRWAGLARIIRGMTKSIREREFVTAAQSLGQSDFAIIVKHIVPQTFSFLIVSLTLDIPYYILSESGLSLIGLGIQDPDASWGNMLSDAMNISDIKFHPWILIPGFFIFITVMAFNFLGDGLRDSFDPKARR